MASLTSSCLPKGAAKLKIEEREERLGGGAEKVGTVFHASWDSFPSPLLTLQNNSWTCRLLPGNRSFQKFNALNVYHMHQDLDKWQMKEDWHFMTGVSRWQSMLCREKRTVCFCREGKQIEVSRTRWDQWVLSHVLGSLLCMLLALLFRIVGERKRM